jgi:hypothetical protein
MSMDTYYAQADGIYEDTTINDIQHILKFVLENVFDVQGALPEFPEPNEQLAFKVNDEIQTSHAILIVPPLSARCIKRNVDYPPYCVVPSLDILTPPPRVGIMSSLFLL